MTERLARSAARHPWRWIGAWIAAIVLSFLLVGTLLGDGLTTDATVTNNPESVQADRAMHRMQPDEAETTELVVVRNEELLAEDQAFRDKLDELAAELDATGAAAQVVSPYEGEGLISEDGHAVLVPIRLQPDEEETVEDAIAIVEAADGEDGFAVDVTGNHTTDRDFNELSQSDLEKGELRIGLPAALLVLLLIFGAVVGE